MKNKPILKENLKSILSKKMTAFDYDNLHKILNVSKRKLTSFLLHPKEMEVKYLVKMAELCNTSLDELKPFIN